MSLSFFAIFFSIQLSIYCLVIKTAIIDSNLNKLEIQKSFTFIIKNWIEFSKLQTLIKKYKKKTFKNFSKNFKISKELQTKKKFENLIKKTFMKNIVQIQFFWIQSKKTLNLKNFINIKTIHKTNYCENRFWVIIISTNFHKLFCRQQKKQFIINL